MAKAKIERTQKLFLKGYYNATQPGADPRDLHQLWDDYIKRLQAAAVVR